MTLTYRRWFHKGVPPDPEALIWRHVRGGHRLSHLARFRLGMHGLEIQRGRFTNTPRSMRWCRMCLVHGRLEREDEGHLAIECPFYEEARLRFPGLFQGLPSTGSLDDKMQAFNCPRLGVDSHYEDYGTFWGDMADFVATAMAQRRKAHRRMDQQALALVAVVAGEEDAEPAGIG